MGEDGEKATNVLLVEDTEEHALIITHVLTESKLRTRIFIAGDGKDALDYLYNRGKYASHEEYPKPDLILLDLHLAKIDGLEVFGQIKSDEKIKDIPIIVLTSSKRDDDIFTAYKGGAKSYILKSTFIIQKSGKMEGLLDAVFSLM
jgi:CheY-like chemotaxis protein